MAYVAKIVQKYRGTTIVGPTDTRDEAARLARATLACLDVGGGVRQADPVMGVDIVRVDDDEVGT